MKVHLRLVSIITIHRVRSQKNHPTYHVCTNIICFKPMLEIGDVMLVINGIF